MESELLILQDALAGAYSIERELGRGGMGIVYLAREVQLDRLVAIKVLPAALAARDDVRARFLREARTAASLSHPSIVPIHSVGEAGGLPYFVMTFIDGPSLGERLRERGPVSTSMMTSILRDVGQALGYAHSRGIVHRDVKPDNILLETVTGRALVTDFGIASVAGEAPDARMAGTVEFMSPQQLRGEPADARSDLFALGVVAHLALSGALPSRDGTAGTAGTAGATGTAELPPALGTMVARCLADDPDQRFANAESLVASLDASKSVARSTLPPELRAWAQEQVPLFPLYGLVSFTGLVGAIGWMSEVTVDWAPGSKWTAGPAWYSLAMAVVPLVPIGMFQLRKTRRALAAGYRLADLRFALRSWVAERREAIIDQTGGTRASAYRRSSTRLPLISLTVALVSAGLHGVAVPEGLDWVFVIGRVALFAGVGSVGMLTALGLPIVPPSLQRRLVGRVRSWLWNGRVGEWLARRLTPKTEGVPVAAFRPTEMALNLAIEDLFASLPDPYRETLGELPAVARRLTARVTELRETGDRLSTLGAGTPAATANATRLTETVTALERLRLGLLRLHSDGMADLRPLTTAIAVARSLDRDVTGLVDAQAEVSGIRTTLAFERRTPSPA